MTSWFPTPSEGPGPFYRRLADAIEQAIGDGTLPPDSKLPPQRDLAFDLKVTIGTIGRAYAMLRERGLVAGEVGRGTYVLGHSQAAPGATVDTFSANLQGTRLAEVPADKLRFDTTAAPEVGQAAVMGELFASVARDHPQEIASYSRRTPDLWLEAGASWLGRGDFRPKPEDIVPTQGVLAGSLAVVLALVTPGERVVVEALTYSQFARSTRLLGRRTVIVETDEHGMVPEDFERVCAQQHPKLAFLMPAAHNPTLSILSEARRRAIAEIARRHEVWLIEDDLYGAMSGDALPRIAEFAPERTFVAGGLSKAVAAGLRGAWVACPAHYAQRVRTTHKMMTGGLSFILAEAGARLVVSGEAKEIERRCRAEVSRREALARAVFEGYDFASHPHVPFFWLKLPSPWLSGTFKTAALREGAIIDDEDEFKADRMERTFHRARVAFSSGSLDEIRTGFTILRRLLDSGVAGYDAEI
ncbi:MULTISPECIES: PLP-dependent aminotransferase family protein [unclassified Aureimonas]|uniref:aminotransferase-like domain-containing protein n=1 Tax=unclassified Aureimonas TaxID=2615206 RepID=UPI0006FE54E3|nr:MULTISPECIES: PLP-dependent aminotransferase family protein [unclassified Aureimonas]KQT60562.1 GntR family transcriptional regulator [Aureimonas sp. Leaf427]KQT79439.1 GntR family transcriptional regulator [Aureimonas sp. Leaf460]